MNNLGYNRKHVSIKETVDHKTGEVIIHESSFIKRVNSEEFIRVYLEDISGFLKISSGIEFKVLIVLWKESKWNNTSMVLDKIEKQKLADLIGIKLQSVSDTLTRLVKKDILLKRGRMRYLLNPVYFFKGDEKSREEVLKFEIQYQIEK